MFKKDKDKSKDKKKDEKEKEKKPKVCVQFTPPSPCFDLHRSSSRFVAASACLKQYGVAVIFLPHISECNFFLF
jgi:hypothetical protein